MMYRNMSAAAGFGGNRTKDAARSRAVKSQRRLTSFLEDAPRTFIVIDSENADFRASLSSFAFIERKGLNGRIGKVFVWDDENSLGNWGSLGEMIEPTVEYHLVQRVKHDKSRVDHALIAHLAREIASSGVNSVIIISSDSDYSTLFDQDPALNLFPGVRFLVLLDYKSTAPAYRVSMETNDIPYVYLRDLEVQDYNYTSLLEGATVYIDGVPLEHNSTAVKRAA